MSIRYENYDWTFDKHRFAERLRGFDGETLTAAQELSGLSPSAFLTYINPQYRGAYENPGMKNFLAVCNLLDLDPREFFCLDVKGL
jgi:hypothetical protein